jgi:hypothetical protein
LARASVLAALLCALVVSAHGAGAAASGCHLYAAANGRDTNNGRAGSPVRSLGRLVALLRAGQAGCVEAGTRFFEQLVISTGGAPGKPVRVVGNGANLNGLVRFTRDGHDVVLSGLQIHGDGSPVPAIVTINGPRNGLTHSSVDGPTYLDANVACVRLGGRARGTVLSWLVVHNCTRARRTNLYAPGIVVAHARRTTIEHTTIYHTQGDAIVLAPDARGTRITNSLIDGNSSGIYIDGKSSGNVIANNIISFSGRYGVHGDGGSNNLVTGNCIWRGYTANVAGRGFRARGNLNASPRFIKRAPNFELRPGPCFSKRPGAPRAPRVAEAKPQPKPKPRAKPKPRPRVKPLARFTVHYTLRALPARVQVVSLTFTGLAAGARVDVRCRSRCAVSERLVADPNGSATSAALIGRWLTRGAVLVVTERRGRAKATATIRITGLPRGVRISHG